MFAPTLTHLGVKMSLVTRTFRRGDSLLLLWLEFFPRVSSGRESRGCFEGNWAAHSCPGDSRGFSGAWAGRGLLRNSPLPYSLSELLIGEGHRDPHRKWDTVQARLSGPRGPDMQAHGGGAGGEGLAGGGHRCCWRCTRARSSRKARRELVRACFTAFLGVWARPWVLPHGSPQ